MTTVHPEFRLALSYAHPARRPGIEALFKLDATLGGIIRATREPMVGQMRLTWWHEALMALDSKPAPAEPVLTGIETAVLPYGVTGQRLASMTDGWEALLAERLDDTAIDLFARERGARLFEAVATILGGTDPRISTAGEGWALVDLSRSLIDRPAAEHVANQAVARLDAALSGRWRPVLRFLGALALSARFDVIAASSRGSPRRVGRLMLHRLTGI